MLGGGVGWWSVLSYKGLRQWCWKDLSSAQGSRVLKTRVPQPGLGSSWHWGAEHSLHPEHIHGMLRLGTASHGRCWACVSRRPLEAAWLSWNVGKATSLKSSYRMIKGACHGNEWSCGAVRVASLCGVGRAFCREARRAHRNSSSSFQKWFLLCGTLAESWQPSLLAAWRRSHWTRAHWAGRTTQSQPCSWHGSWQVAAGALI